MATKAPAVVPKVKKTAAKKKAVTFTIDCSKPVEDKIMDISSFEKFLAERIKVAGKTGTMAKEREEGGGVGGGGNVHQP